MPDTTAPTGLLEQAGPNASEMRLYSAPGERMYGHVLHYIGCRPTEALHLTVGRVLVSEQAKAGIAEPQKAQDRPQRA